MSAQLDATATSIPTPRRAWFALAVLMLPVLLIAVDNTVLAFALPSIAQDFRPPRPPSCGSSTSTPWCSPHSW